MPILAKIQFQISPLPVDNNHLTQAAMTWYYLSTTGFPWEQEDAALSTWIPLLSNISSTVMVIIGLVTGVKACLLPVVHFDPETVICSVRTVDM